MKRSNRFTRVDYSSGWGLNPPNQRQLQWRLTETFAEWTHTIFCGNFDDVNGIGKGQSQREKVGVIKAVKRFVVDRGYISLTPGYESHTINNPVQDVK